MSALNKASCFFAALAALTLVSIVITFVTFLMVPPLLCLCAFISVSSCVSLVSVDCTGIYSWQYFMQLCNIFNKVYTATNVCFPSQVLHPVRFWSWRQCLEFSFAEMAASVSILFGSAHVVRYQLRVRQCTGVPASWKRHEFLLHSVGVQIADVMV